MRCCGRRNHLLPSPFESNLAGSELAEVVLEQLLLHARDLLVLCLHGYVAILQILHHTDARMEMQAGQGGGCAGAGACLGIG